MLEEPNYSPMCYDNSKKRAKITIGKVGKLDFQIIYSKRSI